MKPQAEVERIHDLMANRAGEAAEWMGDEDSEPDLSDESIRQAAASLWKKLSDSYDKVVPVLKEFAW